VFGTDVKSLVLDAALVGTEYLLVRPDAYVAAIGATEDELRRLTAELCAS
jgi:hypothetical protein